MRRFLSIAGAAAALSCSCNDDPGDGPPVVDECPNGTDLTYENFGQGFVHTWCLPCHTSVLDADDPRRQCAQPDVNFDTYAEVSALRLAMDDKIQGIVTTGPPPDDESCNGVPFAPECLCVEQSDMQMPPAGGVSDEDAALFHEWAVCGAPGAEIPPPACFNSLPNAGPLALASQADADAFCAAGTNRVAGDLSITASVEVPCLCGVDGTITVAGSAADVSLPIAVDAGALLVVGSASLDRLSAPNLRTLGIGDLQVSSDPALATLDLPWVTDVAGSVQITDLVGLSDLGLGHLANIGGDFAIEGVSAVTADLTRVRTVGGNLTISANPYLLGVDTLRSIYTVGGDLTVSGNPVLAELDMGDVLDAVGGTIAITDNPAMTEIDGFTLIPAVNAVVVSGNGALVGFGGFDIALDAAAITIADNPNLVGVDAFKNLGLPPELPLDTDDPDPLPTVFPDIVIVDNPKLKFLTDFCAPMVRATSISLTRNGLEDLNAFADLDLISGNLAIVDNPALPTAAAQAFADRVDVGGSVTISGNLP
jgi:hypothetical protein